MITCIHLDLWKISCKCHTFRKKGAHLNTMERFVPTFQPSQKSTNKPEALKKKLLRGTTISLDDAGRQTSADGSPQEASSGGSMYYNRPAHQRTFPVSFGSPHVHKEALIDKKLNVKYAIFPNMMFGNLIKIKNRNWILIKSLTYPTFLPTASLHFPTFSIPKTLPSFSRHSAHTVHTKTVHISEQCLYIIHHQLRLTVKRTFTYS